MIFEDRKFADILNEDFGLNLKISPQYWTIMYISLIVGVEKSTFMEVHYGASFRKR